MFIRYMQQVLRNERINMYKSHLNDFKEMPLEYWLLEEIAEPYHLDDFKLTDDEIATTLPKLPLNDVSAIADFVMNHLQLQEHPC